MIKRIRGGGTFYDIAPVKLKELLNSTFNELESKPRVYGYDFEVIEKDFQLYITTVDEREYFVHIDFKGQEKQMVELLTKLSKILKQENLEFDLGYYITDENGNQISEDITLND